jgi:exodeoxyribonuclease V alpha subunit
MFHGYAITVHKAQGSEWKKVFLILHQSHNIMLQRELLYTAVTRAKENLYVICEPEHFTIGVERQRIKGNTLFEKAEYFKGKYGNGDDEK